MSYRDQIKYAQPTPIHKLRKLERRAIEANPSSLRALGSWLKSNQFKQILFTGEMKECNVQYFRQIGKGRYHWRIYIFPEKLVIESHYDKYDPGRGFTKERDIYQMWEDVKNHFLEDVLKNPDHHIINIKKTHDSPDLFSKIALFVTELLS